MHQEREESSQILSPLENDHSWDGLHSGSYLRRQSQLEVTHEDYTNSVAVHPKLPVYLTGNARGLVNMWRFN